MPDKLHLLYVGGEGEPVFVVMSRETWEKIWERSKIKIKLEEHSGDSILPFPCRLKEIENEILNLCICKNPKKKKSQTIGLPEAKKKQLQNENRHISSDEN